jgi:transcription antitermination factor NusG
MMNPFVVPTARRVAPNQAGDTLRPHARILPIPKVICDDVGAPPDREFSVRAIPGTWSVAEVKKREEAAAEDACRRAGLYTYLPRVKQKRIDRSGRHEWVWRPMFTEYLFLAWVNPDQRGDALDARGVKGLLPVHRQQRLVNDLAAIQGVLAVDPVQDVGAWMAAGRRAKVVAGPFAGTVGTIAERRGRRVFLVGVETLGQAVELEVQDWQVEPA